MALMRWSRQDLLDPFAEFDRLQEDLGRLFGVVSRSDYSGLFDRSSLAVDILDEGERLTVSCNLPGVDKKDVELTVADQVLSIKGERKAGNPKKKEYRDESWTGSFQRTIALPQGVDTDKVKAELSDGVLRIKLEKKAQAKPRQISVAVK